MSEAYGLLQAAWESVEDTTPYLVLADWFEDNGESDAAEQLRLTVAESLTGRHSPERASRIRQLEANATASIRESGWAALHERNTIHFERPLEAGMIGHECVAARIDRRLLRWVRLARHGHERTVSTRDGRPLLHRVLSGSDPGRGSGYEPSGVPELLDSEPTWWDRGWLAGGHVEGEGELRRRAEAALAPAAVAPGDLPAELVPHLAQALCRHHCDKGRRVRLGQVVPGAHLFLFRPVPLAWMHSRAVPAWDVRRAQEQLRGGCEDYDWRARHGPAWAALVVQVADSGRILARRLAWHPHPDPPFSQPTVSAGLRGSSWTLPAEVFRQAADELARLGSLVLGDADPAALAAAFVVDTPDKLRRLFTSQPDLWKAWTGPTAQQLSSA